MSLSTRCLPTGLGYSFIVSDLPWADPLLVIDVSQITVFRGQTRALLTASTAVEGAKAVPGTQQVLTSQVYLYNRRSRDEYATALDEVIPPPNGAARIDWGMVLESLQQQVMAREHADLTPVILSQSQVPPPTPFMVEGLIPEGKATILYGAGGVGKSIFAAALAVAVQAGLPFLNLQTKQAKVLYLDWETDEGDLARRVQDAARGMGLQQTPDVLYQAMQRTIEDQVPSLARYVAEHGVGLVIIDSVGMAGANGRDGADPSEGAIRFFLSLRALGVAALAIDHVSGDDLRRGRAGAAKPYGSVYKWNSTRHAVEMRERKPADSNGMHLLLKHRKSNLIQKWPDMALRLVWDRLNGVAHFTRETFQPVVSMPLPTQIMDILTAGPATPAKIAEFLSDDDTLINEIDVRREVKSLIGAGRVVAGGDGQIRAVTSSPAPDVSESEQLPLLDE